MLNKFVFIYLDDILIFSQTEWDHVQHVRATLQQLLQNQRFMKAKKCEFHVSTISFLGFIISLNRVAMHPDKVRAVPEWPEP